MEFSFDDLLSFDLRHDDIADIVHRMKSFGCVKVSNLLAPDQAQAALECLEHSYETAENQWQAGQMEKSEFEITLEQGILRPLDRPISFQPDLDFATFMINSVTQSKVAQVAKELFGPNLAILRETTTVRRQKVETASTHLPFHQDSGVMELFNDARVLNCWVALTTAGTDAPGMEVVPLNLAGMLPKTNHVPNIQKESLYENLSTNIDFMGQFFNKKAYWQPKCEPGDALLMLSHTLHRTHVAADMTKTRYAFEVRFTSRDTFDAIKQVIQKSGNDQA